MLRKISINIALLFKKLSINLKMSCLDTNILSIRNYFTKNKLISDHFWTVSLKVRTFKKMLTASKACFIFSKKDKDIFFFYKMLRKSFLRFFLVKMKIYGVVLFKYKLFIVLQQVCKFLSLGVASMLD